MAFDPGHTLMVIFFGDFFSLLSLLVYYTLIFFYSDGLVLTWCCPKLNPTWSARQLLTSEQRKYPKVSMLLNNDEMGYSSSLSVPTSIAFSIQYIVTV